MVPKKVVEVVAGFFHPLQLLQRLSGSELQLHNESSSNLSESSKLNLSPSRSPQSSDAAGTSLPPPARFPPAAASFKQRVAPLHKTLNEAENSASSPFKKPLWTYLHNHSYPFISSLSANLIKSPHEQITTKMATLTDNQGLPYIQQPTDLCNSA